jgi:hypothetical protein
VRTRPRVPLAAFAVTLAAICIPSLACAQEPPPAKDAPAPPAAAAPAPTPPPPPAPPPKASAPPKGEPSSDWVDVGLVTDAPGVGLYAREPRKVVLGGDVADTWELVCEAPCDQRVDPRRTYRVMGDKIVPSIDFNLAPGSGHVSLRVVPAARQSPVGGQVLAVTAGVSGFAGILLLLLDVAEHEAAEAVGSNSPNARSELQGRANTYQDIGLGFLAGGVVLGVSALFVLHTGTTELTPVTSSTSASRSETKRASFRLIPGGFAF